MFFLQISQPDFQSFAEKLQQFVFVFIYFILTARRKWFKL